MDNVNVKGADEFLRKIAEAKDYLQNDVYEVVGIEAVKHFKQSFQNEGFTDKGLEKWKPRSSKRPGGTNGQKVMSKSGDTAESIDFRVQKPSVIITSDKEHAQIHNEGGEVIVTDKMRKYFWAMHKQAKDGGDDTMAEQYKGMALAKKIVIPKRQFIGESETMNRNIEAKVERDLTRILK